MRIAIFVDTSDGTANAITQIRAGLNGFVAALPADAEVMFITTGRQVGARAPATDDGPAQGARVCRRTISGWGATPLRDALLEVDSRYFRKLENRWPVFVMTGDSAESSAPANETPFNKWLTDSAERGIAAHAFALKYRGGGFPDLVAQHVAQTAGGHFDFMNTANGLSEKLKTLGERIADDAKEMSHWYEVEFETNSDGSPTVEIGVTRGERGDSYIESPADVAVTTTTDGRANDAGRPLLAIDSEVGFAQLGIHQDLISDRNSRRRARVRDGRPASDEQVLRRLVTKPRRILRRRRVHRQYQRQPENRGASHK